MTAVDTYPFDPPAAARDFGAATPQGQEWCRRGLGWLYGFHHEEAVLCFERALSEDPSCAFAHWGIGFALGPNYNKPWEIFSPKERARVIARAQKAAEQAQACDGPEWVCALANALPSRLPETPEVEEFRPLAEAFAERMVAVKERFPEDLDICALAVEALMTCTPWALWHLPTGTPAHHAHTLRAKGILDEAFAQKPGAEDHPALLHLYVHLMEMSPTPEMAVRRGTRLCEVARDSGHLLHMGTHIHVQVGDYARVVSHNRSAFEVDRRYWDHIGDALGFYRLYMGHNLAFEAWGAMFLAAPGPALQACDDLDTLFPDSFIRTHPPLFEAFTTVRDHVLMRFGMWQALLDLPLPGDGDSEFYPFAIALRHATRAVAAANLGHHAQADADLAAFETARDRIDPERVLFNNTCWDILAVAEGMARGEAAVKRGAVAEGLAHLREAVANEDALSYEEPWAWMMPTRHALGALLLDAGLAEEAEDVFRTDLGLKPGLIRACHHPDNIWALQGLDDCLKLRGADTERAYIAPRLAVARAWAEIEVAAACQCALKAARL